eukprot:UN25641
MTSLLRQCALIDFAKFAPFHPVLKLPEKYHVHDFTKSKDPQPDGTWSVGKYNEVRPFLYDRDMFDKTEYAIQGFSGIRNIHMGIDIGGPVGTSVHAWYRGTVVQAGYNPEPGDYENIIITEHLLNN